MRGFEFWATLVLCVIVILFAIERMIGYAKSKNAEWWRWAIDIVTVLVAIFIIVAQFVI